MRYGLISDVHGNLPALERVLDFLASEGVDAYLCAGDLVGYGPYPNECVERVLALPGLCVAGNHDLIAVGALSTDRCGVVARQSLIWTARVLTDRTREALAALPRRSRTEDGVILAHGSLDDPQEYVATPSSATAQLQVARERDPGARVVVVGHTHRALAVDELGALLADSGQGIVDLPATRRHLVNPGAVGQSRERRLCTRAAVLDTAAGRAEFYALDYEQRELRAALKRHRLSRNSIHSPPRPRWRVTAGRVRRTLLPRPPR